MTDIPINDNTPRNQYTATAGQTIFPYGFVIFDQDHLVVQQTLASDGTTSNLTITTDYTVSGVNNESGGNVTLVTGAAAGDIITIERQVTVERVSDYQDAGDFLAQTLNVEQDLYTMMMQERVLEIARCLQLKTEDTSSTPLQLPLKADRVSKFMAFDANGDPIASSGSNGVAASAFMDTVLDDADADEVMTTLFNDLTAETTIALADSIAILDAGEGSGNKMTVANLLLALLLLTAETSPAKDDTLFMGDTDAGTVDQITFENFFKVINTLTTDGSPNTAADYLVSYDADTGSAKKVLMNLMGPSACSQAEQETGTEAGKYVAPATQQFHDSAVKFHVRINAQGTLAVVESYNVSSVDDNGTGDHTINIDNDMANGNYTLANQIDVDIGTGLLEAPRAVNLRNIEASLLRIQCTDQTGTPEDSDFVGVIACGRLAA